MKSFNRVLAIAWLAFGAGIAPDAALAWTESATTAAEMREQRAEELKERLKLTAEQAAQIKPLVEARRAQMEEIRAKYAGDPSRRAKREMAREAKAAAQDFNKKLEPILTDEQEAEWKKIREEARAKVKQERQDRAAGKGAP